MYTRLIILSVIILLALYGLTVLGYPAVEKWAEGLEGARLGDSRSVPVLKRALNDEPQIIKTVRGAGYKYES